MRRQQRRRQQRMEREQAKADEEFRVYQENMKRQMRQKAYYDASMERKNKTLKQRKAKATRMAAAKREKEGMNIQSMAEQRGGTGGLLRGEARRSVATREGYQKWRPKRRGGLSLALRGATPSGSGRRRPQ